MSEFVEVKVGELSGAALDWVVAKAAGLTEEKNGLRFDRIGRPTISGDFAIPYQPSTNWAQGGPLIDKYRIWLSGPIFNRKDYSAAVDMGTDESRGTTALIALCRAIVAAKLGDVVQVPAELVGVAS